jgi:microsomal dipeptidase-like Zn-dependent dipeptidase
MENALSMNGFADIHAHPMAHLAFGGHLIWGRPVGPFEEALPCCDGIDHNAYSRILWVDIARRVLDGIMQSERESSWMWRTWSQQPEDHPRDGYPTFHGWPFAGTMSHQQMHLQWLRRAYDNGLRLMSALAVNNRLLGWLMENATECWDDETIRAQVELLRQIARHPSNALWMEIAYSADDAERIIASNKLAIVLGAEVDQIELLFSHDPARLVILEREATRYINGLSPAAPNIEALAQTIYDVGLRQINPLHFANNSFGGAALYLDRHSTNIRWLNLWRGSHNSEWPTVVSTPEELEFRLQTMQFPINRSWSILKPPIAAAVAQYPENDRNHINAEGMTDAGKVLLLSLWRRGILVDIDHMSMRTKDEALRLAELFGVPVLSSHCWIRDITLSRAEIGMPDDWWRKWNGKNPPDQPGWPMLRHEGMRTRDDVERISKLGGMMGTLLRQPAVKKPKTLTNVSSEGVELMGTTTAAAAAYLYLVEQLGTKGAIGIGSDVNGLAQLPVPSSCCSPSTLDPYGPNGLQRSTTGDRIWDINADGVAHYGMIPDLIYRWRAEGMSEEQLGPLFRSAEGYIETWSRAEDAAKRIGEADASKLL